MTAPGASEGVFFNRIWDTLYFHNQWHSRERPFSLILAELKDFLSATGIHRRIPIILLSTNGGTAVTIASARF